MQKREFRPGIIALVIGILLAGPVFDPGFLSPQNLALSAQLTEVAHANEAGEAGHGRHTGSARAAVRAGIDAGAVAGIENGATPDEVAGAIAEASKTPGNSDLVKSAFGDAQKDLAATPEETPGATSTNSPAALTVPPTVAPGVGYRAG